MKVFLILTVFSLSGCATILKSNHTVSIKRQAGTTFEYGLITKAEALPVREEDLTEEFVSRYAKTGIRITDRWWANEVDGTRVAYTINTDAIHYYKKHSAALRYGKRSQNGIRMKSSGFRYMATVQYFENYNENDLMFQDVYVVKLEMEWGQYCGPLCAAEWAREKTVIFDRAGNVLEVIEPIEQEHGLIMLIS